VARRARRKSTLPKWFVLNFRSGLLIGCAIAIAVAAVAFAYDRYDTKTLKRTVRRDAVYCGVNTGLPGFSSADDKGNWSGFDVDFCRAIAAAIFDDPGKVKFIPLDANERFIELEKRKVDVLARNSTWTISRETDYALHFAGVSYYDGQGFMVPKARKIDSALDLGGSKVCVQIDTTTELNLDDYFRANNIKYQDVKFAKLDNVFNAYQSGQCDTLTADVSQLYALRLKLAKPGDHTILPDVISKEPLAPVVRHGDDQWHDIVDWVVFALIQAEESSITKANVDDMLKSDDPNIKRMLGVTPGMGKVLGLDEKWAYNEVKMVGNYGEIFDKNLGLSSPLKLERGYNNLWTKGGLIYAMPIR